MDITIASIKVFSLALPETQKWTSLAYIKDFGLAIRAGQIFFQATCPRQGNLKIPLAPTHFGQVTQRKSHLPKVKSHLSRAWGKWICPALSYAYDTTALYRFCFFFPTCQYQQKMFDHFSHLCLLGRTFRFLQLCVLDELLQSQRSLWFFTPKSQRNVKTCLESASWMEEPCKMEYFPPRLENNLLTSTKSSHFHNNAFLNGLKGNFHVPRGAVRLLEDKLTHSLNLNPINTRLLYRKREEERLLAQLPVGRLTVYTYIQTVGNS